MGLPVTPEDNHKVNQEIAGMQFAWHQLGARTHYQEQNNLTTFHPPASLMHFLTMIKDAGVFPEEGTTVDEKWARQLTVMIGIFRWAQICFQNGVKYDDLLQCTCARVPSQREWKSFEDWLTNQ